MSRPVYKTEIVTSFRDVNNSKKINPKLIKFSKYVARIAVLDFGPKELITHYEKNFYKAKITYVHYKREIIGFFIAVFFKDPANNSYSASGFPAIRYKLRHIDKNLQSDEKQINFFREIMIQLIWRYLEYYLSSKIMNPATSQLVMNSLKAKKVFSSGNSSLQKILAFVQILISLKKISSINNLTVIATAENPIMYSTLLNMNLHYFGNDPKPSKSDVSKILSWNSEQLLLESYKQSLLPSANQHPCLKKPAFTVNITAEEWRDFFIRVGNKNDKKSSYIKYFLWQNFNFPNTAFVFEFKVDIRNIYYAIKSMI